MLSGNEKVIVGEELLNEKNYDFFLLPSYQGISTLMSMDHPGRGGRVEVTSIKHMPFLLLHMRKVETIANCLIVPRKAMVLID